MNLAASTLLFTCVFQPSSSSAAAATIATRFNLDLAFG